MFKKVLICTDTSEASNSLIYCTEDLKKLGVQEAVLVYAVYAPGFEERFLREAMEENLVSQAEDVLEKQRTVLEENGIKTTVKMLTGVPSTVVNRVAEEENVSAILVGSHGKGIFKRIALGSVSSDIISTSKRPVFLVKITLDDHEKIVLACKRMFTQVLYLTDFSDTAEKALNYMENIVQLTGTAVEILHVQDYERMEDYLKMVGEIQTEEYETLRNKLSSQKEQEVADNLAKIKDQLEKAGAKSVTVSAPQGRPIEIVMERIKEDNISSVVMGSRGKGLTRQLFLGSLSLQVVRNSPVPVLLVPGKY